jgi:hypothetical protein
MGRTDAVMFGGPNELSGVPKHVTSLSPGDDTDAVRVPLGLDFSLQKSLFRTELAARRCADPLTLLCPRGLLSTLVSHCAENPQVWQFVREGLHGQNFVRV